MGAVPTGAAPMTPIDAVDSVIDDLVLVRLRSGDKRMTRGFGVLACWLMFSAGLSAREIEYRERITLQEVLARIEGVEAARAECWRTAKWLENLVGVVAVRAALPDLGGTA
jgi:hypothetical protein